MRNSQNVTLRSDGGLTEWYWCTGENRTRCGLNRKDVLLYDVVELLRL